MATPTSTQQPEKKSFFDRFKRNKSKNDSTIANTAVENPDAPKKKWSTKKKLAVAGSITAAIAATIVTGGLIWAAAAPASFIAAAGAIGLGSAGSAIAGGAVAGGIATAGTWIAGAASTAWAAATGATAALGLSGVAAQAVAGVGLGTLAVGAGGVLAGIGVGIKKAFTGLRNIFSSPKSRAEREHKESLKHTVKAQKHAYKGVDHARNGNLPINEVEHLKKDYSALKQHNDNHSYVKAVQKSRLEDAKRQNAI